MQYLIRECLNAQHAEMDLTMATHSPYILTALNIMMLAYRAQRQNAESYDRLGLTIPAINPDQVGAWSVADGCSTPLYTAEIDMIDGTHLDSTSDVYEDLILSLNDIVYG